jgi:hypothetical protein
MALCETQEAETGTTLAESSVLVAETQATVA